MKEYIEKDTAIKWVRDIPDTMSVSTSIDMCLGMKSMKSRALSALSDVPAADVAEVRHGRWVRPRSPYQWYKCTCELCGYEAPDSGWTVESWEMDLYEEQIKKFVEAHPFCTKCGAKMDGGVNE